MSSWYLRVQHLVGRELIPRTDRDWRVAYYLLASVLRRYNPFSDGIFPGEIFSDLLSVEILLELGYDPSVNYNYAIRYASYEEHIEVVKLLLADGRADPAAYNNELIRTASQHGHTEVVKLLLADKRVDSSAQDNYAIRYASEEGYIEVVKLLLADKRVDHSAQDNYAIRYASLKGHSEVVKLLQARRIR